MNLLIFVFWFALTGLLCFKFANLKPTLLIIYALCILIPAFFCFITAFTITQPCGNYLHEIIYCKLL